MSDEVQEAVDPEASHARPPYVHVRRLHSAVRGCPEPQRAQAEPRQGQGLRVHAVRDEVPQAVRPAASHADPHRRAPLHLRSLRPAVHPVTPAEGAIIFHYLPYT